jgi:hypothetical protein
MTHLLPITPLPAAPQPSVETEGLLFPEEAAAYLGLSVLTLADYRCKGGGPVFAKSGRLVRYRRSWLDAWIESRSYSSTSEYKKED